MRRRPGIVTYSGFAQTPDQRCIVARCTASGEQFRAAPTHHALGLESAVTFTLTPTPTGTHLHMEQKGFRRDQPQNYQGAKYGWQKFFGNLEQVLARIE